MKKIICLMCATALLSSCHIYKSYDRPEDITTAGLYRDTASVNDTLAADTANFGNLPWREVFTDPQLQTLIEQALTNNGDLRSAALNVKQAQAALMSARLAYAPTLALSPQGTVSSWDKGKATQIYSLPVTASWQVDLFGQLLNPKRQAKVSLKQTQFYEQAVQTQVIAGVANMYYTLLMLDRQLQITEGTVEILKKNLETVQSHERCRHLRNHFCCRRAEPHCLRSSHGITARHTPEHTRNRKRPLPDVAPTGTEHRTRCAGRATAAYGIFSRYSPCSCYPTVRT